MSEINSSPAPQLSLKPEIAEPAAPSAPVESIQQQNASPAIPEQVPSLDDSQLTDAERKAIDDFITKIDITNPDHVLLFGADAQKRISDFSETALNAVKTQDTGDVGNMRVRLVAELKGFERDTEEPKGLRKLFAKAEDKVERMKARYSKVSVNVENIASSLEGYQAQLLKDVAMFDRLYDQNTDYFRQLTLYIIAGDKKLAEIRSKDLKELMEKAQASGDAMDAQKANDLAAQCDRFEKKLYDLKLTRQVSMQMAPQIRLLQNNDSLLVERIQSTLSNTLPLWKSQMVLALGLQHSKEALQAQTAVTDMTNELLRKNAEALKIGTIETAKEAERGIIDIETLIQTNQSLIDTINEVMTIQSECHTRRIEAEKTLYSMEAELKRKLLSTNL
jgi:uncharacterized protein YaaN involved in tellurite resistance